MHTQTYYDLLEALPKDGCGVCKLVLDHTHRFMDSILYEAVLDLKVHRDVRARRGLCNEHSWQLTQFNGVQLGVAILFEAALDEVLGEMKTPAALGRWRGNQRQNAAVAGKLEPTGPCMVCESMAGAEQRILETLSEHISDEKMEAAFRESDGLCLPHFRQAVEAPFSAGNLAMLISIQKGIWLNLQRELKELIRKSDVQYADEAKGKEMGSWLRAIGQLVGEKGVFGVDR